MSSQVKIDAKAVAEAIRKSILRVSYYL